MKFPALLNFQFSIFNLKSKFNFKILNIENSLKISNFKFQIFFFLLFTIYYLLFTIPPAFAQANTPSPQEQNQHLTSNIESDVPKNLNTWTQTVMIEVMSALSCQLSGINPANINQACLGVDPQSGKIGFVRQSPVPNGTGGAIGVMTHFISSLYNIPIHTGDYVGYLAQNFGIVKPAYAQGTGFEGLKPLIGVWTAFRNIVYLIFTIVFVVIGFAIMFRIKIDPRTVMTIQNQIPKIIIGILLVTFSYAIAGFLIDMMYTTIYLTGNVLASSANKTPADVTGLIQSDNPFSAASQTVGLANTTWEPAKTVGGYVGAVFDNVPGRLITGIVMGAIGTVAAKKIGGILESTIATVGGTIGALLGGGLLGWGTGTAVGTAIGKVVNTILLAAGVGLGVGGGLYADDILGGFATLIAFLVIAIAMLWALFRLWFTLILSYIYILIDVVLAPFWIAGGIIPGSPVSFTGWLRHIVSYLVVFPLTIGLFLLGKIFIDAFGQTQTANEFVPPLIANPASTNAIGAIIGLGIILLTPNVLTMAQKALKAPQLDVGSAMKAIGVGAGAPIRLGRLGFSEATHKVDPVSGMLVYRQGPLAKIGRLLGL